MINLKSSVIFKSGAVLKNKFMLAPLTNQQSNKDGSLSNDELHWLTKRAKGNFGLVMTCASHVQKIGKGFPGQLGIFNNNLIDGHKKLTEKIKKEGSLAVIQLHHAGMRSPYELINEQPVCPSINKETNSRALSLKEVKQLINDFIAAAIRAKKAGYDGVEVHGAHGYILTQFLSAEINNRKDEYGGDLKNRAKIIFEIVNGIRKECGNDFLLGVRLSPERFGMDLNEVKWVCQELINEGNIDFLDISLWDCFKMPNDKKYQQISLLDHFKSLDFKDVKWTVAGKINDAKDVNNILNQGVDFVSIGKSAILHHNFPDLVIKNPNFKPIETPVSEKHLINEGLGNKFITYLKKWPNFIEA